MEITYLVPPLSAYDIETRSLSFIKDYDIHFLLDSSSAMDPDKMLDACFLETGVTLEIVPDEEIPDQVLSLMDAKRKVIQLREADYDKLAADGLTRMTVSHEIGHSIHHLEYLETTTKLYRYSNKDIVPYSSSEWQARVFASTLLMPFPRMVSLISSHKEYSRKELIELIQNTFIVSKTAAKVRLETIEKYATKGTYSKLEEFCNQENIWPYKNTGLLLAQ